MLVRPATLHPAGVGYAVLSGALASGGGYAVWYAVLPRLSATRAGTIQLAVPVLAALAGAALLDERISVRLLLSGAAILGGIGLAIAVRGSSPGARGNRVFRGES
jgi:drug/metabolite transporter (DMT)-like permease